MKIYDFTRLLLAATVFFLVVILLIWMLIWAVKGDAPQGVVTAITTISASIVPLLSALTK